MRLGAKARVMMAGGLAFAALFLALAIREMQRSPAQSMPLRAHQSAAPTIILAAAVRPIRIGETIAGDMVRNAPANLARNPLAATAAEIVGKVATRDIPAGSLITRDAVGVEAKLAIRVPMGMRAVSIDTTAEIAVAGLVRPGDRVDVQVVYPGADAVSGARGAGRSRAQTLLQMVQVLAVGESIVGTQPANAQTSDPQPPARTVTMALTPDQVSILSLAKNTGSLTLSLRNPADAEQLALATAASRGPDPALPAPMIAPPQPQQRARATPPSSHAIELVIGDRRETLQSGSIQP